MDDVTILNATIAVTTLAFTCAIYIWFVFETPQVYYAESMAGVVDLMPSLKRTLKWPIWCYGAHMQFLSYSILSSRNDRKIANVIYEITKLELYDGEKTLISWGKFNGTPKGILLLLHTVYGDYSESATIAQQAMKTLNLIPVSYSRRGHSFPLTKAEFNTVGSHEDLQRVLDAITSKYPNLPIYAIGSSAGSSLLARYLGDTGDNSRISGAVLISPGYDFEKSQMIMPYISTKMAVKKAKRVFLTPNEKILSTYDPISFTAMLNAGSMEEWHQHQWRFAGNYKSMESYYNQHNPVYVLKHIRRPTLYVNAMDDIAFPKRLTSKFRSLPDICPTAIVVHTRRGSHLGFYEGWGRIWSTSVTIEFLRALSNTDL